jgi:hypothetical protein
MTEKQIERLISALESLALGAHRSADGLDRIALQLDRLGVNGAGPMGAIELLSKEIRDGLTRLADALPDT